MFHSSFIILLFPSHDLLPLSKTSPFLFSCFCFCEPVRVFQVAWRVQVRGYLNRSTSAVSTPLKKTSLRPQQLRDW